MSFLSKKIGNTEKNNKKWIGKIISRWLIIVILIAFLVLLIGDIIVQKLVFNNYSYSLTIEYVNDIDAEIENKINYEMADDYAGSFVKLLEKDTGHFFDNEFLLKVVNTAPYYISDINVYDANGTVKYSSDPSHIGFTFGADDKRRYTDIQSSQGMLMRSYELAPSPYDESKLIKYVDVPVSSHNCTVSMGMPEKSYLETRDKIISDSTRNKHVGRNGYIIVCDKNMKVLGSTEDVLTGKTFDNAELLSEKEEGSEYEKNRFLGENCYLVSLERPEYYILGAYPVRETNRAERINVLLTISMFAVVLLCIFIYLSALLKKHVVKGVEDVNGSLSKITAGDLSEKVNVTNSVEFEELSAGINTTVDRLKEMIAEADERVRQELEFAKVIQTSAVPNEFPPFPDKKSFGIYAIMNTAEAVGGDFYDFFMISEDTLALVIADVSEEGLPAALFMMKAKALIKTFAQHGLPIEEVAGKTNDNLCEGNAAGMFVTAWIGFMNINTGVVKYVHAGHTKPIVCGANGARYVSNKKNLLMGGIEGTPYIEQEMKLSPGECLYLYTDGVIEAKNISGELFSEKRLLGLLEENSKQIANEENNQYAESVCRLVYEDVKSYTEGAKQSDDITMLAVRYFPK